MPIKAYTKNQKGLKWPRRLVGVGVAWAVHVSGNIEAHANGTRSSAKQLAIICMNYFRLFSLGLSRYSPKMV